MSGNDQAVARVGPPEQAPGVAELLECPICYLQFERPLQLSCGHTFCANCVNRLVENARPGAGGRMGLGVGIVLYPEVERPPPPPILPGVGGAQYFDPLGGRAADHVRFGNDARQGEHNFQNRLDNALDNVREAERAALAQIAAHAREDPAVDGGGGLALRPDAPGLGGAQDAVNDARRQRLREAGDRRRLDREARLRREFERIEQGAGAGGIDVAAQLLWNNDVEDPFDVGARGNMFNRHGNGIEGWWNERNNRPIMERIRAREREFRLNARGPHGGTQIRCPECRKSTTVPQDGLPVNYRLQDMISRIIAAEQLKPKKVEVAVDQIKCLQCNDVLSGGIYFACNRCHEVQASQMCSTCGLRLHNGHEIEEKRALTEQDLAEAKEAIGHHTARATNVLEQLNERLRQLTNDAAEGIEKLLIETMQSFGHLAGCMDSLQGNTLESLDIQKNKATLLADKYQDILDKSNEVVQANRDRCTALEAEFRTYVADLGLRRVENFKVKVEPEDMDDVIFVDQMAEGAAGGRAGNPDEAGPSGVVPPPPPPAPVDTQALPLFPQGQAAARRAESRIEARRAAMERMRLTRERTNRMEQLHRAATGDATASESEGQVARNAQDTSTDATTERVGRMLISPRRRRGMVAAIPPRRSPSPPRRHANRANIDTNYSPTLPTYTHRSYTPTSPTYMPVSPIRSPSSPAPLFNFSQSPTRRSPSPDADVNMFARGAKKRRTKAAGTQMESDSGGVSGVVMRRSVGKKQKLRDDDTVDKPSTSRQLTSTKESVSSSTQPEAPTMSSASASRTSPDSPAPEEHPENAEE